MPGEEGKIDSLGRDRAPERERRSWFFKDGIFHLELIMIITILLMKINKETIIPGFPCFLNHEGEVYGAVQKIVNHRRTDH